MTPTIFEDAPTNRLLAQVAVAAAAGALLCLAGLHVVSPEFAPGNRMVSEYALGKHGWLLSLMFILWAISSWALAAALWPHVRTTAGNIGVIFLVLAGVGEAMASLFDIQHPLHGVSAMIGTPSLVIAALLASYSVVRQPAWVEARGRLLTAAHLTWISFVLMAIAVGVMFSTITEAQGLQTPGAILFNGWANRFLVVTYCAWAILAGVQAIAVTARRPRHSA